MAMAGKSNDLRVAFDTLGCKLNQAETELLARQFVEAGYKLVSPAGRPDVYVLNTCTVTRTADQKSRQRLRLANRRNPGALVVATGCYAERAPEELLKIEGIDLVVGNERKLDLLGLVEKALGMAASASVAGDSATVSDRGFRNRSFIKLQDGCNKFCAYCIVPLVRPREESLPVEQVVTEIQHRADVDVKEVVLTGVEVGRYNHNGVNLKGLLERVLAGTDVTRLRLSSLQPDEISPELIGLWRDGRLCRHFHLSLQSGSDAVLSRMRRRYSVADYRRAVSLIRSRVPGAAITTDIIAGFPGETDEEFEESYQFCRQMNFARIHVFTYSPRPGTLAAQMPSRVTAKIKKERSQRLLALADESADSFHRRFLGQTLMILWEQQDGGVWSGLSGNYIRVYTRSDEDLTNRLLPARLVEISGDGVWGRL